MSHPRISSPAGASTPAERKNQAVWELINHSNYKQALQLCNRRLKKGEKGEYLLTLKALVLTKLGPDEALEIARKLGAQTPPINSAELLKLLATVWDNLGDAHAEEAGAMWERSVKANPKDEDLARQWFYSSVRAQNWGGAQKAAMNLQKTFTRRREYWFWAVVASLLLHNSLPKDAPQRKLFGTLAYRMMDKARTDTPEDTTVIPPRAIQTSQELNLLLELLPHVAPSEPTQQALVILNSANLGVDSKVGSGDWWGLARKRLDLLDESGDWKALFETSAALLAGAVSSKEGEQSNGDVGSEIKGRGDDWRVWDGYVKAAGKLHGQGEKEPAQTALETIQSRRTSAPAGSSRNADLALVKFASQFPPATEAPPRPEGAPSLLEACTEYYDKIGRKSCCFEDLQSYVQTLADADQAAFLHHTGAAAGRLPADSEKARIDRTVFTINHQKFHYLLRISPIDTPADDAAARIAAFVSDTLNTYLAALELGGSLLTTDDQYGDDAALLACMGLFRLYQLSSPSSSSPAHHAPLYQAIIILETVLTKSRHNYQAQLLLLRLYLLLGAVSPALSLYPRLNIKQIQHDTLSHYLLTRITTLLPRDARVAHLLADATTIYDTSASQTPNMVQLAFDRGAYAQLLGFVDFAARVAGSVARALCHIELARLARLLLPPSPSPAATTTTASSSSSSSTTIDTTPELPPRGIVYDNRDFDVVVNCELDRLPPFGDHLQLGPRPRERWVRVFVAVEQVLAALNTAGEGAKPPPQDAEALLTLADDDDDGKAQFTPAEAAHVEVVRAIAGVLTTLSGPAAEKKALKQQLESLTALFAALPSSSPSSSSADASEMPGWEQIHALWMRTHSVLAGRKTLAWLARQQRGLKVERQKEVLAALEAAVARAHESGVRLRAAEARRRLDDEDALQALVDAVLRDGVGAGSVLCCERPASPFGGVQAVAERVRRLRAAVVEAVAAAGT